MAFFFCHPPRKRGIACKIQYRIMQLRNRFLSFLEREARSAEGCVLGRVSFEEIEKFTRTLIARAKSAFVLAQAFLPPSCLHGHLMDRLHPMGRDTGGTHASHLINESSSAIITVGLMRRDACYIFATSRVSQLKLLLPLIFGCHSSFTNLQGLLPRPRGRA